MRWVVNIWWEGASIHYSVTSIAYNDNVETEYWCSGAAYGGEDGDKHWSRGKPSPECQALADFSYYTYLRRKDRRTYSWGEYQESLYRSYVTAVGMNGPMYSPIVLVTVHSEHDPWQARLNPGTLFEELKGEE